MGTTSVADASVKKFNDKGIGVVAVIYGTPSWNRVSGCNLSGGDSIFCAPDNPAGLGRFAAMLADRYDGTKGLGTISTFVVLNEVNHGHRFGFDCGDACKSDDGSQKINLWVSKYADVYNTVYDSIKLEQPNAKVLTSFTHRFGSELDDPIGHKFISVESFLPIFASQTEGREWAVAYHAYPKHLLKPSIDEANDYPYVTMGNIGVLTGWLRKKFPNDAHAWNVYLTEQGFNSHPQHSSDENQRNLLCKSFENILGTPRINMFLYHYAKDTLNNYNRSWAPGLLTTNGDEKQAWLVWSSNNSCGWQNTT